MSVLDRTVGQRRPGLRDRGEGWAGVMAMVPMVAGLAPFALVLGSVIAEHPRRWRGGRDLADLQWQCPPDRASGRRRGGGAPLAIASGLLVNARVGIYSASLAARWRGQPSWFRPVAAALLIDPTWALAEERLSRPGSATDHRRYYLGAGITLAVGWAMMVTAGMVVGHQFGGAFGLDLAVPLCLVALVGPRLGGGATWVSSPRPVSSPR